MTRELLTLGQRLKYARKKRGFSQEYLAKRAEVGQPTISKLELGRSSETAAIVRIAFELKIPASWLESGKGAEPDWNVLYEDALDHPVSLEAAQTVPSITREQLMNQQRSQIPEVFRMPIENEEMAPRVRRGDWVLFSSALVHDARPGDGVLVRDQNGGLHFRVLRSGHTGSWEAHAENVNYRPLRNHEHGLELIAVLTAVEGRWS